MLKKSSILEDYKSLPYAEQRKIDQKAYFLYYNSCINEVEVDENDMIEILDPIPKTFNNWWGSEKHMKYVTILLRKTKLNKIYNKI